MVRFLSPVSRAALALLVLASGACRQRGEAEALTTSLEPRLIDLVATDSELNPSQIVAMPGERLILRVRNLGSEPHGLRLTLPSGDVDLPGTLEPSETGTMRLVAPATFGQWELSFPERQDLGAQGSLVVRVGPQVRLVEVARHLTAPLGAVRVPGPGGRIAVFDQVGLVYLLTAEGLVDRPFLDLRRLIVGLDPSYDERGLLGLAFHPQYANNGRIFVFYSAPLRPKAPRAWDHTNRISEWQVSSDDPTVVDEASERVLLEIDHPYRNHNGGTIAFGPDGLLYVALGDGGGGGDIGRGHTPGIGNGQDRRNLLGSILRIDVEPSSEEERPYRIPDDNPFAGSDPTAPSAGAAEVYAYGFRNPYGLSFDRGGGHELFVSDAGQSTAEEIDLVRPGGNYGWNIREGTHCFNPREWSKPLSNCAHRGPHGDRLIPPVAELANSSQQGGLAQALIGGVVYRGSELADLEGRFVLGVWSRAQGATGGALWALQDVDPGREDLWAMERILVAGASDRRLEHFVLGIGEDDRGELMLLTTDEPGPTGNTGRIFRLVQGP